MCFIFFLFQLSFFSFEVTVRPYYKTFNALDEDSIDTSGLKDCEMFFLCNLFPVHSCSIQIFGIAMLENKEKKKKLEMN